MWSLPYSNYNEGDEYEYQPFTTIGDDNLLKADGSVTHPSAQSSFFLAKPFNSNPLSLSNHMLPNSTGSLEISTIENEISDEVFLKNCKTPSFLMDFDNETYDILLNLLSINKSMQEKLLLAFTNIQQSLKKIRAHQAFLFNISMRKNTRLPKKSQPTTQDFFNKASSSSSSKASIRCSYFKDHGGEIPDLSSCAGDARLMNHIYSLYPRHIKIQRWTPLQRVALARAIRTQNQKLLLDNVYEQFKGEFLSLEYASSTSCSMINDDDTSCLTSEDPHIEYNKSFSIMREIINSIYSMPENNLKINIDRLDWLKISQSLMNLKSPEECLIQWIFYDHPLVNNQPWDNDELDNLSQTVSSSRLLSCTLDTDTSINSLVNSEGFLSDLLKHALGKHQWQVIADKHGNNRTAISCFIQYQRFLNKSHSRNKWSADEDELLKNAIQYFGDKNWQAVSGCLEGRSGQQCLHRWLKSLDPKIYRGRWTPLEDDCLREAVRIYGVAKWSLVQKMVPGRTDVQCRERWSNILDPSINLGKWTEQETLRLKDLITMFGRGKWSLIASRMSNRTDNQCARRWKQICKKKKAELTEIGDGQIANKNGNLSIANADVTPLDYHIPQKRHVSTPDLIIDSSSQRHDDFSLVYSNLLQSQSNLPKGRLKKLKLHLSVNKLEPHNLLSSQDVNNFACKIDEPLIPISLESHNTKALKRLLDCLFHDESDIDSLINMELSSNAYISCYSFLISNEYKDLYRRFECLFVWPYLLGLAPPD